MGLDISGWARETIWWSESKGVWKRFLLPMAVLFCGGAWRTTPMMKAQEMPNVAPSAPKSHRMAMPYKFSYTCDGGAKVTGYLRERNARVVFGDKSYSMKQVEAASGTKYSGGKTLWWSNGEEGFLQDETKEDQPVRLAEKCRLKKPTAPTTAEVNGTGSYHHRK